MRMNKRSFVVLACAVALAGLAACDHSSDSGGASRINVKLTDAPIDGVSAVNVTISSVQVFPTDTGETGGIELDSGPISVSGELTLNLLDLRDGQVTLLGTAEVAPGTYNRVRLIVESAEVVVDDDGDPGTPEVTSEVTVPSGKIDVLAPMELSQGEDLTITLDFDAEASLHVVSTGSGTYILRPVVTVVAVDESVE
jgi:hypothetical protein